MELKFLIDVPATFLQHSTWSQIRTCYEFVDSYNHDMILSIEAKKWDWTNRGRRLIVALVDDVVIGIACVETYGSISIYVKPDVRRKGHGTSLFRKARDISSTLCWRPPCGDRHDSVSQAFYDSMEKTETVQTLSLTG